MSQKFLKAMEIFKVGMKVRRTVTNSVAVKGTLATVTQVYRHSSTCMTYSLDIIDEYGKPGTWDHDRTEII